MMMDMRQYHATGGKGYQIVELGGESGDYFAIEDILHRRMRIVRRSQVVEVVGHRDGYSITLKGGEAISTQTRPVAATIKPDDADPADSLGTVMLVRGPDDMTAYLPVESIRHIVGRPGDIGCQVSVVYFGGEHCTSTEPAEVLAARLDRLRRAQKAEAR